MTQSPNLDSFLENSALINRYYSALSSYYGGDQRFPRESFDAILKQLREVSQKYPELSSRLWETTHLGSSYSITVPVGTSGSELNTKKWTQFQNTLSRRVQKAAGDLARAERPEAWERVQSLFQSIAKQNLVMEESIRSIPKAEAMKIRTAYFQKLQQDRDVREALYFLQREILETSAAKSAFSSNEPDLIVDFLKRVRQNPKQYLSMLAPQQEIPDGILSHLVRQFPNEAQLHQQRVIITTSKRAISARAPAIENVSAGTYTFAPLPRRIHGIWKGVPLKECTGGCKDSLARLTPARWATAALGETQLHNVELNGRYQGFVQSVPLIKDGKKYASVDFGCPVLAGDAFFPNDSAQSLNRQSFFSKWLHEAQKNYPADWAGFVIGEDDSIRNSGVLERVHHSLEYHLGEPIGDFQSFSLVDGSHRAIADAGKRIGPNSHEHAIYGDITFDAGVKNSGSLRVLHPLPQQQTLSPKMTEAIKRRMNNGSERITEYYWQAMKRWAKGNQELQALLVKTLDSQDFTLSLAASDALMEAGTPTPEILDQVRSMTWARGVQGGKVNNYYAMRTLLKWQPDTIFSLLRSPDAESRVRGLRAVDKTLARDRNIRLEVGKLLRDRVSGVRQEAISALWHLLPISEPEIISGVESLLRQGLKRPLLARDGYVELIDVAKRSKADSPSVSQLVSRYLSDNPFWSSGSTVLRAIAKDSHDPEVTLQLRAALLKLDQEIQNPGLYTLAARYREIDYAPWEPREVIQFRNKVAKHLGVPPLSARGLCARQIMKLVNAGTPRRAVRVP